MFRFCDRFFIGKSSHELPITPKIVDNSNNPCSILYWTSEYDERGNLISSSNKGGFWCKYYYDCDDNCIIYHDSEGNYIDYRKYK